MKNKSSFIKQLLFLLAFLIVLVIFLLVYIIPELKEYKSNKVVLKKYEKLYKNELKIAEKLKIKQESLEKTHKQEIDRSNKDVNIKKLKSHISEIFNNCEIIPLDSNTTFNIVVEVTKNKQIYTFIKSLESYENLVKINFPIEYKKDKKINIFSLKVTIVKNELKKN